MKHRICARGIAAASLALASTTASAAPPVAAYANAVPVVASPARVSAGLIADGTVTNPADAITAADIPPGLPNSVAKTASEAKPTSGNPVEPHHRLTSWSGIMRPRLLRTRSASASPALSISRRAGSRSKASWP